MAYTLTGSYLYGDGSPRTGRLKFEPTTTVVGADSIILPSPLTVELVNGAFSVSLAATDDPAYSPSGWLWTVTESMDGGRAPWSFEFTADADIAELSGVPTPPDYTMYDLTVAATTTGDPGTDAAVSIAGNAPNQELSFTIPRGDVGATGATGATGPANTLSVSGVTTGDPGTDADVVISGTAPAQSLAFTIPRGATGADGDLTQATADTLYAPLASPTFTGTVTVPTPAATSNTTVAASTAFVRGRTRVTHPNTDDVLVQQWDDTTGAWQTSHYDSGWRDVTTDVAAAWSDASGVVASIRRIGATVILRMDVTTGSGLTQTAYWAPLTGFRPVNIAGTYSDTIIRAQTGTGTAWALARSTFGIRGVYGGSGSTAYRGTLRWETDDAIPTSLPGVLVSPAPA